MATSLSNLLALLALDNSSFLDGLSQSQKASDSFSTKIGKGLSNVGGAVVASLAVAGTAAVGFLASTIEPASDLNETISKTTVVFGDNAAQILEWSKTTATSLGLSQNSALTAAATYGNLFRAMEISEETSSKMSIGLVQLAGDLASFNNMDPTEVLDKLRAGLTGETEPLKSLGVNINQALLEQKALELGLWDGVDALDASAKAQASYALIMEQTALAQGDFARTSDGLANQQRILKAQFDNVRATIGTALLPVMTTLATTLSEYLAKPETTAMIERLTESLSQFAQDAVEFIPQAITAIQNGFTWLKENEGVVVAIFAVLSAAVLAWGITTAVAAWTALAPLLPVIAVILLIAAVVYLLYEAWTSNWGGIQEKTQAVMDFIQEKIDAVMTFIENLTSGKLGALSTLWQNTTQAIQIWWETFTANIQLILQAFSAAFQGDWYRFGELLRQAWDNAWQAIGAILRLAWTNLKTIVSTLVTNIINFFKNTNWGQVGRNILEGIANGIKNSISLITTAAKNAANAALNAAKGFLGIKSPSSVFEMQVGWQMAAGAAAGWEQGLQRLFAPAQLQPATIDAPTRDFRVAAETAGGAGSRDPILEALERIAKKDLDYARLARAMRDEMMKRGG